MSKHPFDPNLSYINDTVENNNTSRESTNTREPVGNSPIHSDSFQANHQPILSTDLFDVSNDEMFPFDLESIVNTDIFSNLEDGFQTNK